MGLVLGISLGALFVSLGNVLGKIRPNWLVGIRTPWTMSSKLAWSKTHRVGGWLFVALGVAIIAISLLHSKLAIIVTVIGAIGVSLGLTVYSYLSLIHI